MDGVGSRNITGGTGGAWMDLPVALTAAEEAVIGPVGPERRNPDMRLGEMSAVAVPDLRWSLNKKKKEIQVEGVTPTHAAFQREAETGTGNG